MKETQAEFVRDLSHIAKIVTPDDSLTITVYISPNDAVPVIEIDGRGELRVYVNDGAVFDGDTEARYILKHDAGPSNRYIGLWDNVANTWYIGDGHLAYYFAGVPMWTNVKDARAVLGQLNRSHA